MIKNKYVKVALFIIAVLYAVKCSKNGHDFEVFVDAGGKIIHGQNIFKPPFAQNLQYYYSPLFALLLAPFSALPIMIPQLLWIGFSYFLLYRIWILCVQYFDTSAFSKKQMQLWLLIAALLALRFILVDIGYVQMTTFLLWATLESMQLIKRGKYITGAALLALAINIKLLPLAFVLYLFYRNYTKAALLTCVFYVVYLFIPALYLGWQQNASLLKDWFSIINPANKEWNIESDDGPSSLVALIPVYLTDTTGILSFKRNFVNLKFEQVSLILNLVRLAFVLLTLAFLRTLPFKSIKSNIRQFWEMCYLFIAIPLIYPHQQQYAFVYLIPAFVYISWYFIVNWEMVKAKLNYFTWALLIIIGFNFTPLIGRDVISSQVCEVLLYLRILPMAVIMLIGVLWFCRPRKELAIAE
ncbi:glycosyltransferase family 87 protein [Mucilaginibacter sp. SP1R1]|uniref:glycosyltransferase family 87 protein n=1 Tax=Mucilaginibacter sp. SP1R1 TaxID=2723091 RepID=UPI001619DE58|nr:glycosyltransferase family 87 protein [Mucilaginibacter sp. SP1R1]MBB6147850.1 hypothetical protein [Mucilaginibacter sp. SP1R1]